MQGDASRVILRHLLGLAVLLPACGFAWAQDICGSLQAAYGPYDYRTERYGKLNIVERFHMNPEVEALIRGQSSSIGGDLDYVLKTSPNHHRALVATVRYGERLKTPQPPGMEYSIDCYFVRAIRFQRDDTVVRELYAHYLVANGRTKEAAAQLDVARELAKDNALSHYNIGLIYFELKDYDRALAQAHIASEQGYDRPNLREKLKGVGKWQDPPTPAEPPPAAASAPSTATSASSSP